MSKNKIHPYSILQLLYTYNPNLLYLAFYDKKTDFYSFSSYVSGEQMFKSVVADFIYSLDTRKMYDTIKSVQFHQNYISIQNVSIIFLTPQQLLEFKVYFGHFIELNKFYLLRTDLGLPTDQKLILKDEFKNQVNEENLPKEKNISNKITE